MFIETNNTIVPYTSGPLPSGIIPPGNIASRPKAERTAFGIIDRDDIAPADPIPPGKIADGEPHVARVNGVVKWVQPVKNAPVLTLAQRREPLKDRVKAYGATLLNGGYHRDFGGALGDQVLQLRDGTNDARNWLASQGSYTAAVMLGQGAVEEARIRTEANETITLSYQDALGVLLAMQGWAAALFNVSWSKQDAIDAASTHAAMDALEADIETGWPV